MHRPFQSILIANRGEIVIRIVRAAAELGLRTVSVFSTDDESSLHRFAATEALALSGSGSAAYLDIDAIIGAALSSRCEAVHPGYGFLSENAQFARRCQQAGLVFIGPTPETLDLYGDKSQARQLARQLGVPVLGGTDGPTSVEQARAFMQTLGADAHVMIKAIAGGGGRGMRVVESPAELEPAYARCQSEAMTAFGRSDVYVEQLVERARHIEIQVIGDGAAVSHLGERECSVQRRNQKLVEIAPSPWLAAPLRARIAAAAVRMASQTHYRGLGTFEFLVDEAASDAGAGFYFIEANPRLQVEHTITEEVTGVDLVRSQIRIAMGATLDELGLVQAQIPAPRGCAIQFRVNMESMGAQEHAGATDHLLTFETPCGPGVRVDTFAYAGFAPSHRFDSLIAKLIVTGASFEAAASRGYRALCEFRIEGLAHNLTFLRNLARHPEFLASRITTRFVDERLDELVSSANEAHPRLHVPGAFAHASAGAPVAQPAADDPGAQRAPLRGTVMEVSVVIGQRVGAGEQLVVVDAMKMEHVVSAAFAGVVTSVTAAPGLAVRQGDVLVCLNADADADADARSDAPMNARAGRGSVAVSTEAAPVYTGGVRPDLAEAIERRAATLDAARPQAVARRRKTGQRTARENLQHLCDEGSFLEYGALAVAGQRGTRSFEELRQVSPADGFIYGLASVNAPLFGPTRSRCLVAAYDYTVFAGTQGYIGHKKHDRLLELAVTLRIPFVIFAEGGGGRPADSDNIGGVNLANPTFWHIGKLSGLVPLVGVVSGRCFAGNAVVLGCCDVVIATENATVGMGGPVMIEGAGLGVFTPEEVGPAAMHEQRGSVDLLVRDEAQAVDVARQYLSYFQGSVEQWQAADQTALREAIPLRRTRAYDVRQVIELLADTGSVLELRSAFGAAAVTALVRIEGRPVGLIANNPKHNAGAIGSDESDKLARFIQLCDAFDLPIVSLCDTPGFMVGPEAETTAQIRHCSRIFVTAANVTVPFLTIVLRKAYGLGGQAMAGGSFHKSSMFTVAWPTAEFGSMGLEGQVRLGYRAELEAIADPVARQARYQALVDGMYERGKAVNVAPFLSIDDVIDPADTRTWLIAGLRSAPAPLPREGRKRANIDSW